MPDFEVLPKFFNRYKGLTAWSGASVFNAETFGMEVSKDGRLVRCFFDPEKTNIVIGSFGCAGKANNKQKHVASVMAGLIGAEKPDFFMDVGDIVYPSGINLDEPKKAIADIKRFLPEIYGDVSAPFFLTTGNHEANLTGWALKRSSDEGGRGVQRHGERSFHKARAHMDAFVKSIKLLNRGIEVEIGGEKRSVETYDAGFTKWLYLKIDSELKHSIVAKFQALYLANNKAYAEARQEVVSDETASSKIEREAALKKLFEFDFSIDALSILYEALKNKPGIKVSLLADKYKAKFFMPDRYFFQKIYAKGDASKPAAFVLYLDSSLFPVETLENIHGEKIAGFNVRIQAWLKEIISYINKHKDVPLILSLHHSPTHLPGRRAISKTDAKKYFISAKGNHNRYVTKALVENGLPLSRINVVTAAHEHTTAIQDWHDVLDLSEARSAMGNPAADLLAYHVLDEASSLPSTSDAPVDLPSTKLIDVPDRPAVTVIAGGAGATSGNNDFKLMPPGLRYVSESPAFTTVNLALDARELEVAVYVCGASLSKQIYRYGFDGRPCKPRLTDIYSDNSLLLHPRFFFPEFFAGKDTILKAKKTFTFNQAIKSWRNDILLPILTCGDLSLLKYAILTFTKVVSDFEKIGLNQSALAFLFSSEQAVSSVAQTELEKVRACMAGLRKVMQEYARIDLAAYFTQTYGQIALLYAVLDIVCEEIRKNKIDPYKKVVELIEALEDELKAARKNRITQLFSSSTDASSSSSDDEDEDDPELVDSTVTVADYSPTTVQWVDRPSKQLSRDDDLDSGASAVRMFTIDGFVPNGIKLECINRENLFCSVSAAIERFLSWHRVDLVCVIDEMDQYTHVAVCYLLLAVLKEAKTPESALMILKSALIEFQVSVYYEHFKAHVPMGRLIDCIYQQLGQDFEKIFGGHHVDVVAGAIEQRYAKFNVDSFEKAILARAEMAEYTLASFIFPKAKMQLHLYRQCFSFNKAGRLFAVPALKDQIGAIIGIDFKVNHIVASFQRLYTQAYASLGVQAWVASWFTDAAVDKVNVIKGFYKALLTKSSFASFCSAFSREFDSFFSYDTEQGFSLKSAHKNNDFLAQVLRLTKLIGKLDTAKAFENLQAIFAERDSGYSALGELKKVRESAQADEENSSPLERSLIDA